MRECSSCRRQLELDWFHADSGKPRQVCKECSSVHSRARKAGIERERVLKLMEEQDMKCFYCGNEMAMCVERGQSRDRVMSVDHVVPGSTDVVVLACLWCNMKKNNLTPAELRNFADKIEEALA